MEKVKHAFIICAYKNSQYLEKCVVSLVNQTVPTKIIICTSTPSEFISNIANKYGIQLVIREGQSDIQDDWNYASECVDAEWITVAHQDDEYHEKYAEVLGEAVRKNPDAIMAFSDYRPIIHDKITKDLNCRIRRFLRYPMRFKLLASSRWVKKRCLSLGNTICCPSVTYHKSMIKGHIFTSDLKYSLDWDTFLKFAEYKAPFVYVDQPLTYYRIHNEATTMEWINNERRIMEDRLMFSKFWPKWVVKLIMKFYVKAYKVYSE